MQLMGEQKPGFGVNTRTADELNVSRKEKNKEKTLLKTIRDRPTAAWDAPKRCRPRCPFF